ncbi:MAG: flagellar hook-length control protein FliK [Pseudomonadota bacterium]
MDQLLTLTGQSELFQKGTSELKLNGDAASSGETGDFAKALLSGLKLNEKGKEGQDFSWILPIEEPPKEIAAGDGKLLQALTGDGKIELGENHDHSKEAPILEMLEQMQALLVGASEDSESGELTDELKAEKLAEIDLQSDVSGEELIDKVSSLLQQMGTDELSDEQRQQLAAEFVGRLSDQQKQQLAAVQLDQSVLEQVENNELLSRLQLVGKLANAAVNAVDSGNGESSGVAVANSQGAGLLTNNGEQAEIDEQSLAWLQQQIKALTSANDSQANGAEQSNTKQTQQVAEDLMAQIKAKLADADQLNQEQKQNLKKFVDALDTQLNKQLAQQAVVAQNKNAADSNALAQLTQLVENATNSSKQAQNRPTPVLAATADVVEQAKTAEMSLSQKASADADADAKSSKAESRVEGMLDGKLAGKSESSAESKLMNAFTNSQNREASETVKSFSEQLNNSQNSVVSTQSGAMKSSEASSTLQSSMQAIQKPFDPQQSEASQKLQERINIMLSKNVQRADIRLDPPELGQLQIRVNMNGEQASVQFQVQSQQARDAVEAAMPRLKEMLEQQGVALADTNVSEQQQQSLAGDNNGTGGSGSSNESAEVVDEHQIAVDNGKPLALGAVDFYV